MYQEFKCFYCKWYKDISLQPICTRQILVAQHCSGWHQTFVPPEARSWHHPVLYVELLSHILGKLPLVPARDDGTIPLHMHGRKDASACFPLGVCDRQGFQGSGSPLFYINSWAMIWPIDYKKGGFWELSFKQSFLPNNVSFCALVHVVSTDLQFQSAITVILSHTVQKLAYTFIHIQNLTGHKVFITVATCY
jgi:hypothetical protein